MGMSFYLAKCFESAAFSQANVRVRRPRQRQT
jgi:hypothetical protein